jgi:hypothetical protein
LHNPVIRRERVFRKIAHLEHLSFDEVLNADREPDAFL